MKIIKGAILGTVGGLLYALISFYLLRPILRNDLHTIALYGVQGCIFGAVYVSLQLASRNLIKRLYNELVFNLALGAITGLVSCSPFILVTWYNSFINTPAAAFTEEFTSSVITELIHISVGNILLGLIIGFVIGSIGCHQVSVGVTYEKS